ncbi:leucine-rich repeat transmembrane protein kinase protein [Tanacetum coccineum]
MSLAVEMTMFRSFISILILHVAYIVYAQNDQSGFISLDCGSPPGSYTDNSTGINYVSDEGFIEGGATYKFATSSNSFQLSSLRYFPEHERNCYTLRPLQGKNNRYLIRAIIGYGNYDYRDQNPQFDLYLGADYWATVNITDRMKAKAYEIIHLSLSDYINVCLINTGHGIPIISALELRLLDITMYEGQFQSLIRFHRRNFGSNETVRYKDDVYDRIWYPQSLPGCRAVNISDVVSAGPSDEEKTPLKVRSTALTPINSTNMLTYSWVANASDKFIIYIHIAEVEVLKSNQKREFNIYLNGAHLFGPFSPSTSLTTITNQSTHTGFSSYEIELIPTLDSTLPPLYNAIETYTVKQLVQNQTQDRDAISNTKYTYGLKRNWQGDPCVPHAYAWDGLNCSYKDTLTPRIISLNLSSSGLMGEIATALANLTMIESLDMSNNNLTRIVPKFLADLDFLRFLGQGGCAPLQGQGVAPLTGSRGRAPCWGPADLNGIFGRAAARWGLGATTPAGFRTVPQPKREGDDYDEKLDKFEGHDFRRWQKKMHFLLTTLKVVYVLTTPIPELMEDSTIEAIRIRAKWENDDYICRGHILNGMSDSLFDVYTNVESAKELWDSLESKCMAEDSSSNKFLVNNFNNYKLVNGRFSRTGHGPVKYNELL